MQNKWNSKTFLVKEDHKLRSIRRNKRLKFPSKFTKRTKYDLSGLEHQISKWDAKSNLCNNDQIDRISRRSILTNQEYEQW